MLTAAGALNTLLGFAFPLIGLVMVLVAARGRARLLAGLGFGLLLLAMLLTALIVVSAKDLSSWFTLNIVRAIVNGGGMLLLALAVAAGSRHRRAAEAGDGRIGQPAAVQYGHTSQPPLYAQPPHYAPSPQPLQYGQAAAPAQGPGATSPLAQPSPQQGQPGDPRAGEAPRW